MYDKKKFMHGISFANLDYLDRLYQAYKASPEAVDATWRSFFEGWELALSLRGRGGSSPELKVYHLIEAYRIYGHLGVAINPIAKEPLKEVAELSLERHGFKKEELGELFPSCGFLKEKEAPLQTIVEALKKTYCGNIGIEYMGLQSPELEEWLQKRIEPGFPLPFSAEDRIAILHDLTRAEIFETFLHTKYVGQKRFSLEGGETFIPMLATILEAASEEGVSEAVVGMAHRGRLNVLANIMNKSYASIFYEFEDFYTPDLMEGTGDVKYHKGFTGHLTTKKGKKIHVTLSANSSHLESVDPIVEGQARAKQEVKGRAEIIPILIHGDSAVCGQGVVYETMQLCKLNGYGTGGTLHIVINNQIGFTTLPKDSRSTRYSTDIALGFGAPVFHVNAEKPEECTYAAKLALEIRQKFHSDVFIDLNCYRKYGHNEGDEPVFTQPIEYQLIHKKESIRKTFQAQLIQEGVLTPQKAEELEVEFKESLQKILDSVQKVETKNTEAPPKENAAPFSTAVSNPVLVELAQEFCTMPTGLAVHPKVQKLFEERLQMVQKSTIDWGMAEYLAYATLLVDGIHVRISGQDTRRGTFSHRHGVIVDQKTEERYFPLSHLKDKKAPFDIFNSPLSEMAALGFEFGYSVAYPKSLVIWEAQYGDFANGAQIIIDAYIAASEQKWTLKPNLTLMLPHGYEGAGPEHSSARIERFLQLSAENNMFVVNCTTPAQLFHLLRRQALSFRPLILFSPKAILRHPLNVSSLDHFSSGTFEEFLDDPKPPVKPKRLLICSGKIFYDLFTLRKRDDIALLRIEQLYPFNKEKFTALLAKYKGFQECFWVQEEHSNIGAWHYIHPILEECIQKSLQYVGRGPAAASATGSHALHKKQHLKIMEDSLE